MNNFQNWLTNFYQQRTWYDYSPVERLAFVTEELGELAQAIRTYEIGRDRPDETPQSQETKLHNIQKELGDVMANLTILAHKYGCSLEDIFAIHQHKLINRYHAIHDMVLFDKPFETIKNGTKTIELRLYDEKRQRIQQHDYIRFTHHRTGEQLMLQVLALHVFESFEQLYQSLPLDKCGYDKNELESADHSDMLTYYSANQQAKYHVVGIELLKIL